MLTRKATQHRVALDVFYLLYDYFVSSHSPPLVALEFAEASMFFDCKLSLFRLFLTATYHHNTSSKDQLQHSQR